MERHEIDELHYITALVNLPSIVEQGIACHRDAARMPHVSVADADVQRRRAQRRIPDGLALHEYANLYFNARNSMLYRVMHNYDLDRRVPAEELGILRITPDVLDQAGVVITDINAAADVEPRWYSVDEGLPHLDRAEIFAVSWNHADASDKRRHMQRMMAEVLVPGSVAGSAIRGIYVTTDAVAAGVTQVAPTLDVEVRPYMFFRGQP